MEKSYKDNLINYANMQKDTLTKIVMKHFIDVSLGNDRETLNEVDILYPSVEKMFGTKSFDMILNDLNMFNEKNIGNTTTTLEDYFYDKYDSGFSYDDLVQLFDETIIMLNKMSDEKNLISVQKTFQNNLSTLVKEKQNIKVA